MKQVGQPVAQRVKLQGGVAIGIDVRAERIDLARKPGAVRSITNGRGADCVIIATDATPAALRMGGS